MKILAIHSDYITFEPTKKAIASAEEIELAKKRIDECLVVFMSVEKDDEKDFELASQKLVNEVKNISNQVNTKKIVLYPYAHLSSKLAKPDTAIAVMKKSEELLKEQDYEVSRAPFGWYKSFEIKCKGHPLSELSREITLDKSDDKKEKKDENFTLVEKELTDSEKANLSASILIAKAITEIFPESEIGISGIYNDTAYTDISGVKLRNDDFSRIEKKAKEIVGRGLKFEKVIKSDVHTKLQKEIMHETDSHEIYKFGEIVTVSLYKNPFLASSGKIQSFKITNIASAYWKNNSKNEQLVRVYSAGFTSKEEAEKYRLKMEEAEKRDHRNITKDLDLVYFHEFAPGAPFFLKKGTIMYNLLIDFIRREYEKRGYDEVITPQMYNKKLWEISGHWDHYKENMFIINVEGQEHSLKPMNCPSHCLIYKRDVKSYKHLPIRIADFCNLHRNELSGTLTGLTRVRKFSQDDGHIFCRFDQIEDEVLGVLEFIKYVWTKIFNFKLTYYLSTRPEKALGTKEIWDNAEEILSNALKKSGIDYQVKAGEGAFYGPKIDMDIEDALGRKWQCPTCQLDFNLPQRFELTYEGEDGKKHQPVMIHRAVLGSLERFFGIMTEHFSGKFPLWLSPIQVKVVTVADRHIEHAKKVVDNLKMNGLRVELDERTETIGKKVREAQLQKINYIITIGDKEVETNNLAIRTRQNQVMFDVNPDEFLKQLLLEIEKMEIK